MVATLIYGTDAELKQKMGAQLPAGYTDAMQTAAALQAESDINIKTDKIWAVDAAAYALLPTAYRYILAHAVATFVAIEAINYDFSPYFGDEATIRLNLLDRQYVRDLELLSTSNAKGKIV